MKLVHLGSPVGLPSEQAHSVQITKMCEAFAESGHETLLLSATPPESGSAGTATSIFDHYAIRPAFEIKFLACLDLRFLARRFRRAWEFVRSITYALHAYLYIMRHHNNHETILFSRERFTSYLLLLSHKRIRAKHIFESHVYLGGKHSKQIIALFRHLDRLVATTPRTAELYLDAGMPSDKVVIVPNGVDPSYFKIKESQSDCRQQFGVPLDRPLVGYIGNFRNTMGMEKGIPDLLRAHALLLQRSPENPPYLACVGGPAETVPAYERMAAELGLSPEHYRFAEFAARPMVPRWLRACDVLTIPWPQNEWAAHQTSPIKLYEYMAAEVPIVASAMPSIENVLVAEQDAALFPPGDFEALAGAIEGLLADPEKGRRLAANARAAVKEYTWARRVSRILDGV